MQVSEWEQELGCPLAPGAGSAALQVLRTRLHTQVVLYALLSGLGNTCGILNDTGMTHENSVRLAQLQAWLDEECGGWANSFG